MTNGSELTKTEWPPPPGCLARDISVVLSVFLSPVQPMPGKLKEIYF